MSTCIAASLDVALLGCGTVGSAFARLVADTSLAPIPLNVTGALVRDVARHRAAPAVPLTADPRTLFLHHPHVLVELLGGVEPARTLILEALERKIPVVTANKTLLARCGTELRRAADDAATPLVYEAAVIAGVPFLGTFARRPLAAAARTLLGIVNGTSNYVLTRCAADGCDPARALAAAQRHGYAEPDPGNDVKGIDAAEKLSILLQHFASVDVHPDSIETAGLDTTSHAQIAHARALGGVIKPVVLADWTRGLEAFVGPAFVPAVHVLSRVDGVDNVLVLGGRHGRLLFQGPGAGPDVTAATVLDDVHEVLTGLAASAPGRLRRERPFEPVTGWLVTLDAAGLPCLSEIADLFASYGIYTHRTSEKHFSDGREYQSFLVLPVERPRLAEGLRALRNASGCSTTVVRALEAAS